MFRAPTGIISAGLMLRYKGNAVVGMLAGGDRCRVDILIAMNRGTDESGCP